MSIDWAAQMKSPDLGAATAAGREKNEAPGFGAFAVGLGLSILSGGLAAPAMGIGAATGAALGGVSFLAQKATNNPAAGAAVGQAGANLLKTKGPQINQMGEMVDSQPEIPSPWGPKPTSPYSQSGGLVA
jgi:hypothetical protein